jgi:hypothetical protein
MVSLPATQAGHRGASGCLQLNHDKQVVVRGVCG